MKIVNKEVFLELPANTVFTKYEPCIMGELLIKGDTITDSKDFFYQQIADSIEWDNTTGFVDTLVKAEKGESVGFDFNAEGRDGLFEENQLFAVWERKDVEQLIKRLQECVK